MLCDRNCFRCRYDDCIVDEAAEEEIEAQRSRDAEARKESGSRAAKYQPEKARDYYLRNKEHILARNRAWYQMNRERVLRRAKERRMRSKNE